MLESSSGHLSPQRLYKYRWKSLTAMSSVISGGPPIRRAYRVILEEFQEVLRQFHHKMGLESM